MPLAACGLFFYNLGIPVLFSYLLLKNWRLLLYRTELLHIKEFKSDSNDFTLVNALNHQNVERPIQALTRAIGTFGILFRRYRPEVYWWELVMTARKLGMVGVKQLPYPHEQAWAMVCVLIPYCGLTMQLQPYDKRMLVVMDILSTVISIVLAVSGFIFAGGILNEHDSTAGGYFVLAAMVVTLLVMGGFVAVDSFPGLASLWRITKLERSHEQKINRGVEKSDMECSRTGSGFERRLALFFGHYSVLRHLLPRKWREIVRRREATAALHVDEARGRWKTVAKNLEKGMVISPMKVRILSNLEPILQPEAFAAVKAWIMDPSHEVRDAANCCVATVP